MECRVSGKAICTAVPGCFKGLWDKTDLIMVWIKICGITSLPDAKYAEACGADAIGVVVCSDSPRSVPLSTAKKIFASLSPRTTTVAVTHTRSDDDVKRIEAIGPHAVQVFSPRTIMPPVRTIRALGPGEPLPGEPCWAIIIDGSHGTGRVFDSEYARRVIRESPVPVILAGGLNPGNVGQAILDLGPFGVDVASGTEQRPGIKDPDLVRRFITAARAAGRQ